MRDSLSCLLAVGITFGGETGWVRAIDLRRWIHSFATTLLLVGLSVSVVRIVVSNVELVRCFKYVRWLVTLFRGANLLSAHAFSHKIIADHQCLNNNASNHECLRYLFRESNFLRRYILLRTP